VDGLIGGEPAQRLQPLPLRRHRPPALALVGGDDNVHEPLEEVALGFGARPPGRSHQQSANALCLKFDGPDSV